MKKLVVLGMGVCMVLAFASCKSSESAYKKAYEKAKQQELAEPQVEAPVEVDSLASVISTLHLPEAVTLPFAVMSVCQEAKPMLKADMAATQTAAPAMTCLFLIFMDKAPLFVYCRVQKLFRNTIIVYEYC